MPEETHASTSAEHAPAEKSSILKPEPGLAIWTVVTFLILLVVLKKLAWGPILENLDRRQQAIRDSLMAAEKAAAEASSRLEEQGRILQEARREAQELMARSRADAEHARAEMVARAREESEKIVRAGREAIEQDTRAAIQEIRRSAVDLALAASGKLLRARIDDAKSRELVGLHIDELERGSGRQKTV